MKKLSKKLKTLSDSAIPIKYMLTIPAINPVVKVYLKDDKGKDIEVVGLTQYKDGIVVLSKDGSVYSNVEIVSFNKK